MAFDARYCRSVSIGVPVSTGSNRSLRDWRYLTPDAAALVRTPGYFSSTNGFSVGDRIDVSCGTPPELLSLIVTSLSPVTVGSVVDSSARDLATVAQEQAASALTSATTATEQAAAALSSATAAAAAAAVSRESWAELALMTPAGIGQRAQVSASDPGTHTGRTAASPGADVSGVANSGVYGAYGTGAGQWRRDGDLSATGLASSPQTIVGAAVDLAVTPAGDKAALDACVGPGGRIIDTAGSYAGFRRAWVDTYGRMALGITDGGAVFAAKIVDGQGRLVYPRIQAISDVADQALAAANTGGASPLRQAMLQARALHGRWPRPSMDTPPTVSLNGPGWYPGGGTEPAGFTRVAWNAVGKWRTRGGYTSTYGVGFLQWRTASYYGNGVGFNSNNGCAVELDHSGTEFYIYLRGNGTALRILVDGAYATPTKITLPSDGQGYMVRVLFAAASTRRIMIEATQFQFGGVYVKAGESITAPSEAAPPKIIIPGTSITEGGAAGEPCGGYCWWLGRLLGADIWSAGVGGAGIVHPGDAPKVKQLDRSQDYTAGDFVACIDENGINDIGRATYQVFLDEYRRNLDAWFTAHPGSPWIGWGPFYPTATPPADAYHIRDAKQQAIDEYKQAAFIDTLEMGPLIPSVMSSTYIHADGTHPLYRGAQHVGAALYPHVDRLIRTRF